jgi:hypothetical protein
MAQRRRRSDSVKILFLDIDGVLNCHRTALAFGGYPFCAKRQRNMFDEAAVTIIRGIVNRAGASIVLSSSWRLNSDWQEIGPAFDLPIIDRTPSLPGNRGTEIAAWLEKHPEVDGYVIVDDDSDMLDEQLPFFVHTNHADGFLFKHAELMANLFGINVWDVNRPGHSEEAETA